MTVRLRTFRQGMSDISEAYIADVVSHLHIFVLDTLLVPKRSPFGAMAAVARYLLTCFASAFFRFSERNAPAMKKEKTS